MLAVTALPVCIAGNGCAQDPCQNCSTISLTKLVLLQHRCTAAAVWAHPNLNELKLRAHPVLNILTEKLLSSAIEINSV